TDSFVTPTLLNALAGTRFKIVTGYRGAADVDLAIERGEADGRVASWTALKTTRGEWLKDGRIAVPFQTGLKRHADLPDLPLIGDLATSDDGRRILEFMNSDSSVGWNAIAPPEVPADRVAVLRSAFDATLRDPVFLADAQKQGLEIVPGRGDEVQRVVEHTLATPPELVAHLAAIIGGQNVGETLADRLARSHQRSEIHRQAVVAGSSADDHGGRARGPPTRRPRPHRDQQRGALHPAHGVDERRRRRHRKLQPASRQVPRPAPGQVRRHGDLRAERRRRVFKRTGARGETGRRPRRHHQFQPSRP